jgi:hypothetical protein
MSGRDVNGSPWYTEAHFTPRFREHQAQYPEQASFSSASQLQVQQPTYATQTSLPFSTSSFVKPVVPLGGSHLPLPSPVVATHQGLPVSGSLPIITPTRYEHDMTYQYEKNQVYASYPRDPAPLQLQEPGEQLQEYVNFQHTFTTAVDHLQPQNYQHRPPSIASSNRSEGIRITPNRIDASPGQYGPTFALQPQPHIDLAHKPTRAVRKTRTKRASNAPKTIKTISPGQQLFDSQMQQLSKSPPRPKAKRIKTRSTAMIDISGPDHVDVGRPVVILRARDHVLQNPFMDTSNDIFGDPFLDEGIWTPSMPLDKIPSHIEMEPKTDDVVEASDQPSNDAQVLTGELVEGWDDDWQNLTWTSGSNEGGEFD